MASSACVSNHRNGVIVGIIGSFDCPPAIALAKAGAARHFAAFVSSRSRAPIFDIGSEKNVRRLQYPSTSNPEDDQVAARAAAMIAPMFCGEKNSAGEIVPAFICAKPSMAF
jgi:hypothetical protein